VTALRSFSIKLPTRASGWRQRPTDLQSDTAVSFADVAGVDEAKEELQEIVVRAPTRGTK
jgi:ATP-dependent Zn protease